MNKKAMNPIWIMINHPKAYDNRESIKKLGGQWCADSKRWWIPKENHDKVLEILGEKTITTEAPKKKRGRPRKIK